MREYFVYFLNYMCVFFINFAAIQREINSILNNYPW